MVKGSSAGLQYEWFLHNVAYYVSFGTLKQAESVNVGDSIFSDDHHNSVAQSVMSNGMKISYIVLGNPFEVIWDLAVNGGYS